MRSRCLPTEPSFWEVPGWSWPSTSSGARSGCSPLRTEAGRSCRPSSLLEPASGRDAFYLLDSQRARILRFGGHGTIEADHAAGTTSPTDTARQLAELALADAVASLEWGDLPQAQDRAGLAAALYEHALDMIPEDEASLSGLERAFAVRGDAEKGDLSGTVPDRQAGPVALRGRRASVAGDHPLGGGESRRGRPYRCQPFLPPAVQVPVGSIEPGARVEVLLDLPDRLLTTQEWLSLDLGVVISAEETGRSAAPEDVPGAAAYGFRSSVGTSGSRSVFATGLNP